MAQVDRHAGRVNVLTRGWVCSAWRSSECGGRGFRAGKDACARMGCVVVRCGNRAGARRQWRSAIGRPGRPANRGGCGHEARAVGCATVDRLVRVGYSVAIACSSAFAGAACDASVVDCSW